MNPFIDAIIFLISTCAQIYVVLVLLKILLQLSNVDYFNPLSQFVLRFTAPVFQPLQKIFPRPDRIDTTAIIFVIVLNALKIFLITFLTIKLLPNILWLILYSSIDLIRQLITLYCFLIIIAAIFSWIMPFYQFSLFYAVNRLVDPVLKQIRKIIPPISGFDFSTIIALISLYLINNSIIIKWFLPVLYSLTFTQ